MTDPAGGPALHKVDLTGSLGKSTLISSPKVSIPMPGGATPPPASSSQGQGSSAPGAATSGNKGTKDRG